MTLAEKFQNAVNHNLECNEWFDGEDEIAQYANNRIARTQFKGMGFIRKGDYHFNDGSIARPSGVGVVVVK